MKPEKRTLPPAEEVDIDAVRYKPAHTNFRELRLSGWTLRLLVWMLESSLLSPILTFFLRRYNLFPHLHNVRMLENTEIPEMPMYYPEFPPRDEETQVVVVREDNDPINCVTTALSCLPYYNPSISWSENPPPFLYWKIRDFAHAYRSKITTPSIVAEKIISCVDDWNNRKPPVPLLLYFNAEDLRKQAEASTKRFAEGSPISVLDGIFVAIKDDINCTPYPSGDGTSWLHKYYFPEEDAVLVARLRRCGALLMGKANMHEMGLGSTGSNPNFGTVRNPHSIERYPGGSSSGPAALVSLGLCSAAIGSDAGGSVRVPASLCGVIGLKTTFGRIDMKGTICEVGTVEVVSPLAATVEDALLVYSAVASPALTKNISSEPPQLCVPNLSMSDGSKILRSLKLGMYHEWFRDVRNSEVSHKCEHAVNLLCDSFGCQIVGIKLPELEEMRIAHIVSIGCECLATMNADYKEVRRALTLDVRISLALFKSFSGTDYVAAQRLRRRLMYFYTEAFKKADIIVTPTVGITAPKIPKRDVGEPDYGLTACLMQYMVAGNLLGFPAISVPVGHDKEGLPIGLQLMGPPWAEASLLRVASALEDLCLRYRNRPSTFCDVLGQN